MSSFGRPFYFWFSLTLEQSFATEDNFCPQGHLAIAVDIIDCHKLAMGAADFWEKPDTLYTLYNTQDSPCPQHTQITQPNKSIVPRLRNLALDHSSLIFPTENWSIPPLRQVLISSFFLPSTLRLPILCSPLQLLSSCFLLSVPYTDEESASALGEKSSVECWYHLSRIWAPLETGYFDF